MSQITAETVKAQTSGYFHFEDNEVKLFNENGEEVLSKQFASPKEAKEFYDEIVVSIATDEKFYQEFVHYLPEYPPQRLQFGLKIDA